MVDDSTTPPGTPSSRTAPGGGSAPGGTTPGGPARDELRREELPPQGTKPATAGAPDKDPLRGSRTSGFWVAVVGLGVILLLLIIFIAQNTRKTTVSFLGWDGQVPVAVALLIAALAGLSLAGLAGTLRILQLRRRIRKDRKAHR